MSRTTKPPQNDIVLDRLRQENDSLRSRVEELEKTEQALRESQERYALAMKGPNEGLWDWDPVSKELYISTRLLAILGRGGDTLRTTTDEWLTWVHPDDCDMYQRELVRHLKGETEYFESEYRVTAQGGEYRWVHARGLAQRTPEGKAYRMVGSIGDITERKLAEEKLQRAREELEMRVEERTAELVDLNKQLRQEIRERAGVEAALQVAMADVEQANKSKDKFLAAASHDLLQPLNAARLLVSTLQERDLAERDGTLVGRIHIALENAEELLSDLLEISKLDAGAVNATANDFSVSRLLTSLEAEFAPVAQERGLAFHVVQSEVAVRSDHRLLGRILRNFLSNAFRYTENGKVLLGVRRQSDSLRIEVWDTGLGIPEGNFDHVFREFHQLPQNRRLGKRGVGLGLTIVDRIARVLNHKVSIRSKVDRGSCFAVDVPIGELIEPEAEQSGTVMAAPPGDLAGGRIMVIDNEDSIVISMSALFAEWGCTAIQAASKAEALKSLERATAMPEIVLADYHLDDGENGVEAIEGLRRHLGDDLPAAVITANRSDALREQLEKLSIPILYKPVKPGKLRALVTHLLSQTRGKAL